MNLKDPLPAIACVFLLMSTVFWTWDSDPATNVVAITDGDTITILQPDKTQLKVRLAEIDCPEKKQPFGTKAKEILGDKIFGKYVVLKWTKKRPLWQSHWQGLFEWQAHQQGNGQRRLGLALYGLFSFAGNG